MPDSICCSLEASSETAAIGNLLEQMPADVTLVIAAQPAALAWIRRILAGAPRTIVAIELDASTPLTLWCQDTCLVSVARHGLDLHFSLPARPNRRGDAIILGPISRRLGAEIGADLPPFEGGNILIGDSFVLVGRDCDTAAPGTLAQDLRRLGEIRPVHLVGDAQMGRSPQLRLVELDTGLLVEEIDSFSGRHQPIFHLDAFITLAGRGADGRQRLLLGDPRLAQQLIGPHPLLLRDDALAQALDAIAERLAQDLDAVIIRNPLPIVALHDSGLFQWSLASIAARLDKVAGCPAVVSELRRRNVTMVDVRRWRLATQNGGLVFSGRTEGHGLVVLPGYAEGRFRFLGRCEEVNRAIWTDLGFEVRIAGGFQAFLGAQGSPHCMVKNLGRYQPIGSAPFIDEAPQRR